MATATLGVSTTSTTNAASYVTAAFTPAAGDLLVVFASAVGTDAAGTCTNSAGITFTKVTNALRNTSGDNIYMFVANAFATAVSQTCTFDCTGNNATGAIVQVVRVAGMFRTGATAVLQSAITSNQAGATSPAATFAASPLTANLCLGFVGQSSTNTAVVTAPTSWTELNENTASTPSQSSSISHRNSGQTAATVTWGSSNSLYSVIVAELDTRARTADLSVTLGNVTSLAYGSGMLGTDAQIRSIVTAGKTLSASWNQTVENVTANSTLVVSLAYDTGDTVSSITDANGNPYTLIGSQIIGTGQRSSVYYSPNVPLALSPFSVTATMGSTSTGRIAVAELVNVTAAPLDVLGQIQDTALDWDVSTSGDTTQAKTLLVAVSCAENAGNGTVTHNTPAGWTKHVDGSVNLAKSLAVFSLRETTVSTKSISLSLSAGTATESIVHLIAFKEAATGVVANVGVTLDAITLSSNALLSRIADLSATLGDVTLTSAATLAVKSTVATTLDPVTLGSAATVAIKSTVAKTLDDVILSSTATLTASSIAATLSVSLDVVTLSSAATVAVKSNLSSTLAAVTLTSAAVVAIKGNLTNTLGATTLTSSAQVSVKGNLAATLDNVTLSSAATIALNATVAKTLDQVTLVSAATIQVKATLAKTLDNVTLTGLSKLAINATLVNTLSAVTLVSAAKVDVKATQATTLDNVTLVSAAKVEIKATLANTLSATTLASAATISQPPGPVLATLAKTLDSVTLTATVVSSRSATLAATFDAVTLNAAAKVAIKGNVSTTLAGVTLAASSTLPIRGNVSVTLGAVTSTAAAKVALKGNAGNTLDAVTLNSNAQLSIKAVVASSLDNAALVSVARLGIKATCVVTLNDVICTASSNLVSQASVTQTLDNITLASAAQVSISASLNGTLGDITLSSSGVDNSLQADSNAFFAFF